MRRTRAPEPPVGVPLDGYVLVRADELRAFLQEVVLGQRLAALAMGAQERALIDGLLPTMQAAVRTLARAMDAKRRPRHRPTREGEAG